MGAIASFIGPKGSGKSLAGTGLAKSYPNDRVVIDAAGDDGPIRPDDPNFTTITGVAAYKDQVCTLPETWPESERHGDEPMTLVFRPDAGSNTALLDMDHMVGLAYDHGGCLLLVHEVGVLAETHRVPPNMRRVLMHNRHAQLTVIFCGPRPAGIDPLVLAQSDLVYVFDLPRKADRDRVAEDIGWDREDFELCMKSLKQYEYMRYDRHIPKPDPDSGERDYRLIKYPPLPEKYVRSVERWAFPNGRPTAMRKHN
jgi:hypothetical protein